MPQLHLMGLVCWLQLAMSQAHFESTDIGINMADVIEIWADSGEVIERDFTVEELAQRELDQQNYEAEQLAKQEAEAERAAAKAALLEKLGITEDEAKLLLGGIQ